MNKFWKIGLIFAAVLLLAGCKKEKETSGGASDDVREVLEICGVYDITGTAEFEISVDMDQRISETKGLNAEADTVLSELDVYGKTFEEGFREIVKKAIEKEMVTEGEEWIFALVRATEDYQNSASVNLFDTANVVLAEETEAHDIYITIAEVSGICETIYDECHWDMDAYVPAVCPDCDGSGMVKCAACQGSGEPQVTGDDVPTVCRECLGEGRIPCSACNGTGVIENDVEGGE